MSKSVEEWKPVVGYEASYEVSNRGRVRSVERVVMRSNGLPQRWRERILRLGPHKAGYLQVSLWFGGVERKRMVHRLVMEAFVGPCPEEHEVCHGDGDPKNNCIENLRYGTHSENMFDKVKHGRHHGSRRTHCLRGHLLGKANLVPSSLARGQRSCLACSRARSEARSRGVKFSKSVADDHYARVMAALAPVTEEGDKE